MVYGCLHRYRSFSEERTHNGVMEPPMKFRALERMLFILVQGHGEPPPLERGVDGSDVEL